MIWFVLVLLTIYLLVLLAVAWFSLHPIRTPAFVSPGAMGSRQEPILIELPTHNISGWWVPADEPQAVMVMVHGYLMNRAEYAPAAHWMATRGISCLLIDLRAHGRSGGKKCTLGFLEREDVAAALHYARVKAQGLPVGVIGSSMGSAASALALGDDPSLADLLIIDSGYSRLSVAITGWWNFLGGRKLQIFMWPTVYLAAPMAGFSPFSVDVSKALTRFGDKPVLILHGKKDTLAPPSEAQRNYDACVGEKEIAWFDRCGHSEYRWEQPEKFYQVVEKFLRDRRFIK
jgi:alpha-beta hydrolase superfamily lysophospholipase